jgi:hypothetical protein
VTPRPAPHRSSYGTGAYRFADASRIREQCFKAAWMSTVLHAGHGFSKQLRPACDPASAPASAAKECSFWAPPAPAPAPPSAASSDAGGEGWWSTPHAVAITPLQTLPGDGGEVQWTQGAALALVTERVRRTGRRVCSVSGGAGVTRGVGAVSGRGSNKSVWPFVGFVLLIGLLVLLARRRTSSASSSSSSASSASTGSATQLYSPVSTLEPASAAGDDADMSGMADLEFGVRSGSSMHVLNSGGGNNNHSSSTSNDSSSSTDRDRLLRRSDRDASSKLH